MQKAWVQWKKKNSMSTLEKHWHRLCYWQLDQLVIVRLFKYQQVKKHTMRIGCYHFAKKLNQSKYVSIKMIRCCFVSNADQRVHMDKEGMLIDYKILSAGCQFNNAESLLACRQCAQSERSSKICRWANNAETVGSLQLEWKKNWVAQQKWCNFVGKRYFRLWIHILYYW